MPDFIGIDISGLEPVQKALTALPDAAQDAAIDAASKYLIDALQTEQPSPNYVTRKAAYGQTFFSTRQRKWFFAALEEGEIAVPYRRTQKLRRGWKQIDQGRTSIIANETEGAGWVVGENQSRHEARVGWKKASQVVQERLPRMIEKAQAAIEKIIKKLGL